MGDHTADGAGDGRESATSAPVRSAAENGSKACAERLKTPLLPLVQAAETAALAARDLVLSLTLTSNRVASLRDVYDAEETLAFACRLVADALALVPDDAWTEYRPLASALPELQPLSVAIVALRDAACACRATFPRASRRLSLAAEEASHARRLVRRHARSLTPTEPPP